MSGWIALDWGTSRLRAWRMRDGAVVGSRQSAAGMGGLVPGRFEGALADLAGDWLDAEGTRIVACGMVGAREGWTEAPYREVPCAPVGPPLTPGRSVDPRLALRIVPGLCQRRPRPDVMRGEETQIAGLLALRPGFDGVACLPGTHSKWAAVSAGEVTSFQTFMTGEIFAIIAGQSVLRHSVTADGLDEAAFDEGVSDALSRPETLAARLFALRAADLLLGTPPVSARSCLSGLLVGAELAASRTWWLGREVVLIGADGLSSLYARALAAQGVAPDRMDATALVLRGLDAARRLV